MARTLGVFAAGLLSISCAAASTQRGTPPSDPPLTETVDGLRQWSIPGHGALFVGVPPPQWARGSRVHVELPALSYAPHSARPSPREAERLRAQLRTTLAQALAESLGWEVVADGEPGALLRVRSAISDLALAAPPASPIRTTAYQAPSGHVGFVLECAGAAQGEPLLRFGERRPLPGGTFVGPPWIELQRTREAFRRFAEDAAAAIAELAGGRAALSR
jgi:hypothetical protein